MLTPHSWYRLELSGLRDEVLDLNMAFRFSHRWSETHSAHALGLFSTASVLVTATKRPLVDKTRRGNSVTPRACSIDMGDTARGHAHHPGLCPRPVGEIRRLRAETAESPSTPF